MQHLDEGTIHAWLDKALGPDEAAQIESHVAVCEDCAERVATARGMIAASSRILSALDVVPFAASGKRQVAGGKRHAASGMRQAWRTMWASRSMRVAAAIAFLAAGVTVVNQYGDDEPSRSTAVREMADSSPASAAAAPATVAAPEQAADVASSAPSERSGTRQAASGTRETEGKMANPEVDAAAKVAPTGRGQTGAQQRLPEPARTREALVASGAAVPPAAANTSVVAQRDRDEAPARMRRLAEETKENVPTTRNVEGLDLLESSVVTEKTRLVRRTTYEVRPGVVVTLEESLPALRMDSAGYVRVLADAATRAVAQNQRMPRTMKAAPSAPLARAEAARVTNSVRWTEPDGAELTLTGPVSVRELEELKQRVILSRAPSP